jgi:hypothetical protein
MNENQINFEEYLLQFSSKFLSLYFVSRNIKTKVYKTTISPAILYWSKSWSGLLTEEHRSRGCNERVPIKIFEPKKQVHTEALKLHTENLHNFIHHHVLYIFLGLCESRGEGGGDLQYAWGQYMEILKGIIY